MSAMPLYSGAAEALPDRESGATYRRPPSGAHLGLWFDRFVELDRAGGAGREAQQWIASLGDTCGDQRLLDHAVQRRIELARSTGGVWGVFVTAGEFVTGMGLPHPLENGFAWHPTLGVPYLTGRAVKGLVRAWTTLWESALSDGEYDARMTAWFGDGDPDSSAGGLIFFDAFPIECPSIGADVMTPHYGKWYEAGGTRPNLPETIPGDWHDPVPVSFLVTKNASFLFVIAPRSGHCTTADVEDALQALARALDYLGAGAKTAAGYGRMVLDEKLTAGLGVDPIERAMQEVAEEGLREHRYSPHVAWLTELQRGDASRWCGSERLEVAHRLRGYMQDKGFWRPSEDIPGKKDNLKRTLEVLSILDEDDS